MAKTQETLQLENSIRYATLKMGTFGCLEVTIGFGGKERVDYLTYDTQGIFRCYEIKVTKSDFHSKSKNTFVGHYNYYVLTSELYEQVIGEIPDYVGVYVGTNCVKKAKKQDIDSKVYTTRKTVNGRSTEVSCPWTEMLKDSFIRSLYRDSQKLARSQNDKYLNRLNSTISRLENQISSIEHQYNHLLNNVYNLFGHYTAGILNNASIQMKHDGTIKTDFPKDNLQKHMKLLRNELCDYLAKVNEVDVSNSVKIEPIITKEEDNE